MNLACDNIMRMPHYGQEEFRETFPDWLLSELHEKRKGRKNMRVVYVVGGDPLVVSMFEDEFWQVCTQLDEAEQLAAYDRLNLVCFTGGEDVSPYIYGEEPAGARGCNPARDDFEVSVFEAFEGEPMVGICRGGQLLNVLNGGTMIQDIKPMVSGIVVARDDDEQEYFVHVDHHQGMIAAEDADVHLRFYRGNPENHAGVDYSIHYPETRCLCFQPHPEWGHEPTKALFFKQLEEFLKV